MYEDKSLACRDCGREFIFTAGEQEFYATKGFENQPSRCPECRASRKQSRNDRSYGGGSQEREMYTVTCARCGQPAEVPFRPTGNRPVYCRDCYQVANTNNRW